MNTTAACVGKRSGRFFVLLLLIDVLFMVVHMLHELPVSKTAFPALNNPFLSLSQDLGYAEFSSTFKRPGSL